jgi:hypothetical protein
MSYLNFKYLCLVLIFSSCGQQRGSSSSLRERADKDIGVAHLKALFNTSATIVDTSESLSKLKLGKDRSCVMMEASSGRLQTSLLTQRLSKFIGLVKSEVTFDEGTQMQTMAFINEQGLSTQIVAVPSYVLVSSAQIYFRSTTDGRLVEEWTIAGEELLQTSTNSRSPSLTRANLLLDSSIAAPTRFALFYALCD